MKLNELVGGNGGTIYYFGSLHNVFSGGTPVIVSRDLTIRAGTNSGINSWLLEPILAGPFPDMESAEAALLIMYKG